MSRRDYLQRLEAESIHIWCTPTRRHSDLVALAVNKMALVDYSAEVFAAIERDYREFARKINLESIAPEAAASRVIAHLREAGIIDGGDQGCDI